MDSDFLSMRELAIIVAQYAATSRLCHLSTPGSFRWRGELAASEIAPCESWISRDLWKIGVSKAVGNQLAVDDCVKSQLLTEMRRDHPFRLDDSSPPTQSAPSIILRMVILILVPLITSLCTPFSVTTSLSLLAIS